MRSRRSARARDGRSRDRFDDGRVMPRGLRRGVPGAIRVRRRVDERHVSDLDHVAREDPGQRTVRGRHRIDQRPPDIIRVGPGGSQLGLRLRPGRRVGGLGKVGALAPADLLTEVGLGERQDLLVGHGDLRGRRWRRSRGGGRSRRGRRSRRRCRSRCGSRCGRRRRCRRRRGSRGGGIHEDRGRNLWRLRVGLGGMGAGLRGVTWPCGAWAVGFGACLALCAWAMGFGVCLACAAFKVCTSTAGLGRWPRVPGDSRHLSSSSSRPGRSRTRPTRRELFMMRSILASRRLPRRHPRKDTSRGTGDASGHARTRHRGRGRHPGPQELPGWARGLGAMPMGRGERGGGRG